MRGKREIKGGIEKSWRMEVAKLTERKGNSQEFKRSMRFVRNEMELEEEKV